MTTDATRDAGLVDMGVDRPLRRLFVDVSVLMQRDSGTGIQRVVKKIWQRLRKRTIDGWEILAVYADDAGGFRVASADFLSPGKWHQSKFVSEPISPCRDDIFLGLDLSPRRILENTEVLLQWKRAGVRLSFVIYDLLPLENWRWFSGRSAIRFYRWFRFLCRHADQLICISQAVASAVQARLPPASMADVVVLPLGWDSFDEVSEARSMIDPNRKKWLESAPTVLVVGTVEPRKGYDQLISAFEWLWSSESSAPNLLCVGSKGWRSSRLQRRMQQLSATERRFHWECAASDQSLQEFYKRCVGLIAPSRAEGFGLPVAEALCTGLPVLARDLPVFREVGGARSRYFSDDRPEPFAKAISEWSASLGHGSNQDRSVHPTWDSCEEALLKLLRVIG